jgi:S1-C subfamily serine protease
MNVFCHDCQYNGYRKKTLILFGVAAALCTTPAQAEVHKFSSGTGFFVSRQGQIVTNAHVVEPCKSSDEVFFTGTNRKPVQARVIGLDKDKDLALLETGYRPERIASLRWMHTHVQEREKVFLIGYPEARSINSPYVTKTATIKALEGPFGEGKWLQFTDAARAGNSGGPLLDIAGNVVGVVTAKSTMLQMNRLSAKQEVIAESDIAVTAAELKNFLDIYRVHYNQDDSVLQLSDHRQEQLASAYVVHMFCDTGE